AELLREPHRRPLIGEQHAENQRDGDNRRNIGHEIDNAKQLLHARQRRIEHHHKQQRAGELRHRSQQLDQQRVAERNPERVVRQNKPKIVNAVKLHRAERIPLEERQVKRKDDRIQSEDGKQEKKRGNEQVRRQRHSSLLA